MELFFAVDAQAGRLVLSTRLLLKLKLIVHHVVEVAAGVHGALLEQFALRKCLNNLFENLPAYGEECGTAHGLLAGGHRTRLVAEAGDLEELEYVLLVSSLRRARKTLGVDADGKVQFLLHSLHHSVDDFGFGSGFVDHNFIGDAYVGGLG